MIITKNNYFLSSRGEFKTLPKKVLETVLTLSPEIRLNGRSWFLDHVSHDDCYGEDSVSSVYYISQDGCWLIRASDHWTSAKPVSKKKRTLIVKRIASCNWYLDRNGQVLIHERSRWQAGIIKFSDLEEN